MSKKHRFKNGGFTIAEIVIVVAIIGVLSAVAIVNFIRARQMAYTNICVTNMRRVEDSIQNWAIGENKSQADVPTTADLVPHYIKSWPACPQRNTPYVPCAVSGTIECPVDPETHRLE
ncbi:MAG TPA: prepilin-type N-terminal cleavage/methylation domain-containing protein [Candidatus Omnitrophota bacterium]|nr:prepilin-type N-terminal cleavage/methylation domain-containing protein [Candidatus Omnitrophota bacterium]